MQGLNLFRQYLFLLRGFVPHLFDRPELPTRRFQQAELSALRVDLNLLPRNHLLQLVVLRHLPQRLGLLPHQVPLALLGHIAGAGRGTGELPSFRRDQYISKSETGCGRRGALLSPRRCEELPAAIGTAQPHGTKGEICIRAPRPSIFPSESLPVPCFPFLEQCPKPAAALLGVCSLDSHSAFLSHRSLTCKEDTSTSAEQIGCTSRCQARRSSHDYSWLFLCRSLT